MAEQWKTEDESLSDDDPGEMDAAATEMLMAGISYSGTEATESKIAAFKSRHPGAYTHHDLTVLNLPPEKQKEHHRAWIVLVDSDIDDWGMVEDTKGDLLWQPGKGDIVGTWTRSKVDGRIHISLLSAINALEDKAIAIWSEYAEQRRIQKATGKKPRSPRAKKEEQEPDAPLPAETQLAFNSLRAKLRRAKGA